MSTAARAVTSETDPLDMPTIEDTKLLVSLPVITNSVSFRYAYRLLPPFTSEHRILKLISIEIINNCSWYGGAGTTMIQYQYPTTIGLPWHERALALNKYVLDGKTPSGHEAAHQTSRVIKGEFLGGLTPSTWSDWVDTAKIASRNTVFIR